MPDAARLAVQIVNYRTRSYLERCLPSVVADLEQSSLDFELNLLENASGESLDDLGRKVPGCHTYAAPHNLGFGGGHNLLAAKTDAPYLLILNPDVEFLAPDTAKRLLIVLEHGKRVRAAGPKLITETGAAQRWDHGRLRGLRAQISLRAGHSYWRETDVRQEVAWVSGAVLMVERAAFAEIGGFDENLFLYKEDEDLCLRLRRAGGHVIYEPGVVVRHHGSVVSDRAEGLARATDYFFDQHFPNERARRVFETAHRWLAKARL